MHVLITSDCEGKALDRTRRTLDRYATRVSDRAWSTSITEEALDAVWSELKTKASRKTSVTCYVNDGKSRMKLKWRIGNSRRIDPHGRFSMETKARSFAPRPWTRIVAVLARAGGRAHDLGKMSRRFQAKLRAAIASMATPRGTRSQALHAAQSLPPSHKDAIRHEWVSTYLLHSLIESIDLDAAGVAAGMNASIGIDSKSLALQVNRAWERLEIDRGKMVAKHGDRSELIPRNMVNARSALMFGVLTHHRLLGGVASRPSDERHVDRGLLTTEASQRDVFEPHQSKNDSSILDALGRETVLADLVADIRRLDASTVAADAWPVYALIARAMLILADHHVSSERMAAAAPVSKTIYANTANSQRLNQTLAWHLQGVGDRAHQYSMLMDDRLLPCLERQTLEQILQEAPKAYEWQNTAVEHLRGWSDKRSGPCLVINTASTGSGKTHANVKMLAALRLKEGALRITSAFNLRSLTLQTRDAYRGHLQIAAHDIACVIGESAVVKIHDLASSREDDEGWSDETAGDADRVGVDASHRLVGELPQVGEKLNSLLGHLDPQERMSLLCPVLVSTMDHVIAAGDPGRQAEHAKAMLRLATSDLVIDEADTYDPRAFAAVLRMVRWAAVFGRHVVISSATLPPVLYANLVRAWQIGSHEHVKGFDQTSTPSIHLIADRVQPRLLDGLSELDQHLPAYRSFSMENVSGLEVKRLVSVASIPVEGASVSSRMAMWSQGVNLLCSRLHDDHHELVGRTRVSVGLVRMSNIKPCMALAERLRLIGLANEAQGSRRRMIVTCYHAQELLGRRAEKERRLDAMLNRKPGSSPWWSRDAEVKMAVEQAVADGIEDLCFVVVATPVEEVGRDHDFDWAVIEPSSMASVIQTAGRVNRHRGQTVLVRNVIVLNLTYKQSVLGRTNGVYQRPGHRIDDHECSTHRSGGELMDARQLLGIPAGTSRPLDASLIFGDESQRCIFSDEDEKAMEIGLRSFGEDLASPTAWMTDRWYRDYKLRDSEKRVNVYLAGAVQGICAEEASGAIVFKDLLHLYGNRKACADASISGAPSSLTSGSWFQSPRPANTFFSPSIEEAMSISFNQKSADRTRWLTEKDLLQIAVEQEDSVRDFYITWRGVEIDRS